MFTSLPLPRLLGPVVSVLDADGPEQLSLWDHKNIQ